MTPPPMTIAVWSSAMSLNSKSIRVVRIEHQAHVAVDVSSTCDRGKDAALRFSIPALEDAADDRFLPPDLPRLELAVGREAGQLRASAGTARGPIVFATRAKHKIPCVGDCWIARRANQLDVINFGA